MAKGKVKISLNRGRKLNVKRKKIAKVHKRIVQLRKQDVENGKLLDQCKTEIIDEVEMEDLTRVVHRPPIEISPRQVLCPLFKRGKCRKGGNCFFVHNPSKLPTMKSALKELKHSDLRQGDTKFCEEMMEKHGLDYEAMSRDLNCNIWQYTTTQVRKKLKAFIDKEKLLLPMK